MTGALLQRPGAIPIQREIVARVKAGATTISVRPLHRHGMPKWQRAASRLQTFFASADESRRGRGSL